MMRVTVDTNILVSGTFWSGSSFRILELTDDRKILLVLSPEILEEYVIEKVEQKELMTSQLSQKVIVNSIIAQPLLKFNACEDPDDNKILECAVAGGVDCIISNDKHLLKLGKFQGIPIVTSNEFLQKYTE